MNSNQFVSTTLGNIAQITMGQSPKGSSLNKIGEGVPFIQGNRTFGFLYPTIDTYTSSPVKNANRGDILFSVRAPVGDINIAQEDLCIGRGICAIKSKTGENGFLFYLLKNNVKRLISQANGTVFTSVNRNDLESFEVTIPSSLDYRTRISNILSTIDRKIELNNQLNDYLTDLSSAIYNEFINRSSGKWGALSDIVDLIKEPISSRTRPELPYLPIDVIPMKRIGIEGFRPYEEAKSSLQLFKKDDIVIGAMRVYFHRVILTPCKGMTRNTCFVLRPRNKNLREFALLSCFQNETIEFANLHSKGSTMPYAVWKGSFENCPVFIPNEHDLEVFSIRMSPLIDKIRDIYKENSALINLRNGLLSQLLSGKIDLSKFN